MNVLILLVGVAGSVIYLDDGWMLDDDVGKEL
jgi:hypothetical protein